MNREVIMDEAMIAALEEIDREFPNTPPVAPQRPSLDDRLRRGLSPDEYRRHAVQLLAEDALERQRRRLANAASQHNVAAFAGQHNAAALANQQVWRNPAGLVSEGDLKEMEKLMNHGGRP